MHNASQFLQGIGRWHSTDSGGFTGATAVKSASSSCQSSGKVVPCRTADQLRTTMTSGKYVTQTLHILFFKRLQDPLHGRHTRFRR